jgi:hypothetical protein
MSSDHLAKALHSISKELNNELCLVNPFFRISKGTPEQMKKYRYLSYKFLGTVMFFYLLIFIPFNVIRIIFYFFCSAIFFSQYKVYEDRNLDHEILFISHAIGDNIVGRKVDQFYSVIPEWLQAKKYTVGILYTNHALFHYKKNSELLKSKNEMIGHYLIPKFLKPLENIEYLKLVIPISMKCLLLGFKKMLINKEESCLLLKAGVLFYGRATYSNFLIGKRTHNTSLNRGRKFLVLTFEGHSYEQYLIDILYQNDIEIKVVLLQHSPIVLDQHGVKQHLRSMKRKLQILVTGEMYERIFKCYSEIPTYQVIGSSKGKSDYLEKIQTKTKRILFTPEGTVWATVSFLKLIEKLSLNNQFFTYSIRLHPNLKQGLYLRILLNRLSKKKSFSISTYELEEDFEKSMFVIYRSSAVGVQALMSSAIPIFFGTASESGLNVLYKYESIIPCASSPEEIAHFMKTQSCFISKQERVKIFSEIYSILNKEKVLEVFST